MAATRHGDETGIIEPMRVDFVTLFPEMIVGALSHSILARAQSSGLVSFGTANPRDFTHDRHRTVDDRPFGGGPGMVMMVPPIADAVASLTPTAATAIILLDPMGERFDQAAARDLSLRDHVILICGHYEGVDERVRTQIATHCYSVGDYVLTGGELPALTIADAVVRLRPGVLGDPASHEDDSHGDGLLGFPLYTKPIEFAGESVPEVLRSGDHDAISAWRRRAALNRTRRHRPDLFANAQLSPADIKLLSEDDPTS